jgi:DNA repair exonuclease SbcCD ATPase subunit
MATVKDLRRKLDRAAGQKERIEQQIEATEESIKEKKRLLKRQQRAAEIVKAVAIRTQKQLEFVLAGMVNTAQEIVFDDPYKFVVSFEERRGQSECDLFFERNDTQMNPLDSSGYGAADVAAFALRIACWSLTRTTRPTFILDEPFKHLKGSKENKRAILLMKEVCTPKEEEDWPGVQIITISDERAPREDIVEGADKVFAVSKKGNVSKVEEVHHG